jgi:hypothetical protein
MPAGYIYVLENETIPGLVKIGSTERNPEDRAKELMTTGVPALLRLSIHAMWQTAKKLKN